MLYDTDYVAWTEQTAQLLRSQQFHQLDQDHLIEEIESLGDQEWLPR